MRYNLRLTSCDGPDLNSDSREGRRFFEIETGSHELNCRLVRLGNYIASMADLEPWSSEMEPKLINAPELDDVLRELSAREPIFHRAEFGTSRSDFERMTLESFWEVGASGRRYSRKYVLDSLEKRHSKVREDVWETKGFHCRKLAEDTYLLTYTLVQDRIRTTRRTTIWQSTPDGWKIVFHQGTVVQDV